MGNGTRIVLAALVGLGLFAAIVLAVPPQGDAPAPGGSELSAVGASLSGATADPTEAVAVPAPDVSGELRFDTVRVAPDGSGLVAGRAEPGSRVAVVADEAVAAEVEADDQGRFVAFLDLPPSDRPREITLRGGAEGTRSEETVILAPIPAPSASADALTPEAAQGPATGEGPAAAVAEQAVEADSEAARGSNVAEAGADSVAAARLATDGDEPAVRDDQVASALDSSPSEASEASPEGPSRPEVAPPGPATEDSAEPDFPEAVGFAPTAEAIGAEEGVGGIVEGGERAGVAANEVASAGATGVAQAPFEAEAAAESPVETEATAEARDEPAGDAAGPSDNLSLAVADPPTTPELASSMDQAGVEESGSAASLGGAAMEPTDPTDAPASESAQESEAAVVAAETADDGAVPSDAEPASEAAPGEPASRASSDVAGAIPDIASESVADPVPDPLADAVAEPGSEPVARSAELAEPDGAASEDQDPVADAPPLEVAAAPVEEPLRADEGPATGADAEPVSPTPAGADAPAPSATEAGGTAAGPRRAGDPAAAAPGDAAPSVPPLPVAETGAPALDAPWPESPGQAPVLVADAEGVRVLQPALAPGADAEVLATVALDAITYDGSGEVVLAGRGTGGGVVRLYLDNALVAAAPIGADGTWASSLAGTAPGVYTLRVDQVGSNGEVASRIETPFQREERGALAQAMAQSQEAGQTIAMRTVQPGNTLWAIARDRYGEPLMYVRVFEMNRDRIRDPDLIYPGQVFVLPATAGR